MDKNTLSPDEQILILRLGQFRNAKGFSTREAQVLLNWASGIRSQMAALELVLQGKIDVDVKNGEPVFMAKRSDRAPERSGVVG